MALSSVHQHHYGGAAFSAGCAAFLILMIARERKRHNALGAELKPVGGRDPVYKVCVAGVEYWVCNDGIFKGSLVLATASTCLRNTYCLPPAEQIASILLALHHDPWLFEKWRIYQYQCWI